MRHAFRFLLITTLLLGTPAAPAYAVSVQDLVNLKAAGLGDDILVALIESDGSVFRLTAADILALRDPGLSETVILAMLKTARRPDPASPASPVPRPVYPTIGAGGDTATTVDQVVAPDVQAPVVVNVVQTATQTQTMEPKESSRVRTVYVPYGVPVYLAPAQPKKSEAPVYWGFNGQRRPDTWKEKDK